MNKNALIALLSVLTVTFGALAARQLLAPSTPAPALPVAPDPETAPASAAGEAEHARLLARIRELENQLAAARAAATANAFAAAAPGAPADPAASPQPPGAGLIGEVAAMMQEPEFKDMMRTQQKMVMEQFYGELFGALVLDPERLAALKDLLADRMLAGMDAGMALFTQDGDQDFEAMAKSVQTAQDQITAQIRELLSDEEYEVFEQFEATQAERTQVDMFKQALSPDLALNWDQEDALILAMHEVNQSSQDTTAAGLDPMMGGFPSGNFDADTMLASLEQTHDRYLQRAAEILNEQQLRQFETSLQQHRNMQAMSLRMMRQMMGSGDPPPPPPLPTPVP
jgi:hypothetical protein